jgi:hypothetical protein
VPAAQPQGVRRDDREALARHQLVKELLGEAVTFREAMRQEWADHSLARALELIADDPEALAMRTQWDVEPAPVLTTEELVVREREGRVPELLGAAVSILNYGEALDPVGAAEARSYLEEALSLDAGNATAHKVMAHLEAR